MPDHSKSSKSRLSTCAAPIKRIFEWVIHRYDNSILCGYRGEEEQNAAFSSGRSKVEFPNGKHNVYPSNAVDSGPYLPGKGIPWPKTPADWNNNQQRRAYIKDLCQFYHYAGYIEGVASIMEIPIRWGGDWDRDHDLSDNAFDDLVHFELTKRNNSTPTP
jgi:peptidoglycan L-alanyl-D-glutamate endopeptidase CwlK